MSFRAPARPQTILSEGVDSSVAFCYYIANEHEFLEFCETIKQLEKEFGRLETLLEVKKFNPVSFDLLESKLGGMNVNDGDL